jgi:hypothetical protein
MSVFRIPLIAAFAAATIAVASTSAAANPLKFVSETFSDWKQRLFGTPTQAPEEVTAPASGPIALKPGQRLRLDIGDDAPERDLAKGKSRYRVVELPQEIEHAALRVQVMTTSNEKGRGHVVFKPLFYVFGEGEDLREPIEAKPLHLDIRPFRKSRLLGCVTLDKVQRFVLATAADTIGKSYESEVREAVKAPTPGGFYYSTDAVKVKLPYAATGSLILEITSEKKAGAGC